MFTDSPIESTGFVVSTEYVRDEGETSCQTPAQVKNEQETQTALFNDFSSQTDILLRLKDPPVYDDQRLLNFLNRACPAILEELDNYEWHSIWPRQCGAKCENNAVSMLNLVPEECQGKAVSSMSWSSTGVSLAISFQEPHHESWCTHDGQIHIYAVNENCLSASSPTHIINTNSCVKCVSFHPSKPSILVGGLYNGQVLVWDLKGDGEATVDMITTLGKDFTRHSDAITCISWTFNNGKFVTSGSDGMIIFWWITGDKILMSKRFYLSLKSCNPSRSEIDGPAKILGIAFWQDAKRTDFVVAVEEGSIFHCSSVTDKNIPFMPGFKDPVVMNYESHLGIITDITCSSDDLFATCSIDSEIHVYKTKEKCPIHVIHSDYKLFGIEWINTRHGTIACWGSSPVLNFYDVTKEERLPYSIKVENQDSKIVTAKLNSHRKDVIAVATSNCEIIVWNFSSFFQ